MPAAVHLPILLTSFLKKASGKEQQPFGKKKKDTPEKLIKLKLTGFQHLKQEITGA